MGASLLMMVAGLPKSRTNAEVEKGALAEARSALAALQTRLTTLADRDTDAFDQVMAAYRLSKASDEEKAGRTQAIQRAMQAATLVPLDTLNACVEAVGHGRVVAEHGNRSAVSDVRVGLGLLDAAAAGARANVEINLASLHDPAFKEQTSSALPALTARLAADFAAARAALS